MNEPGSSLVSEKLLEEISEDLYENGPCGYLFMLPSGVIIRANQTFLSWTGYERDALLGRRLQELFTVPGKIFYDTHYAPLLRMQGFVNELAFDLVCADGRQLPILLNSSLKRNAAGEPLLISAAIFDATDRRAYERELLRARQEAERASKIKADLLSMISHDIRTPVSAMVTALQLLERVESSPQQHKPLRILKSASTNLLNLLNEVLDFSKIEAGKVVLEEKPFSIRDSLEDLLLTLRPKAEEKGLQVQLELGADVPAEVVGDEVKIGQVVGNLLTNAIKFTEEGQVRLALGVSERSSDTATVRFSVSDTGIGIPQERLHYIFDEFTQVSEETGRKYGGTGLGLAICKRLLELYGSEMRVISREGEGSTFSFELRLKLSA